jgi:hypothetical protein
MGSPYLSSNESIILSTNNVVVNSVPAEAILTNERLMLIDTRHAELRPQDIPFHAIETITIGEDARSDPIISLSLVTGPGVTISMDIAFPQQPKMKRLSERDEWANRIRELSIVTVRASGSKPVELSPPWIDGPLSGEGETGAAAAAPGAGDAESKFRNPPLMPKKNRDTAKPKNRLAFAAGIGAILVIALAVVVYLFIPSLFGGGGSPLQPATPVPTTAPVTIPASLPATTAPPATTVIPVPTGTPEPVIPDTGVFVLVKYDGAYSGSAGAPERFREINATGTAAYQLPAVNEMVLANIQKMDNTGRKLTVEIYNEGKLVQSGSVTAPKGTVSISADLRSG